MATQDRLPVGDGTTGFTSNWTANAGDKWDCVNDPIGSPDDDTTYIYKVGTYSQNWLNYSAFNINSSAVAKVSITSRALIANAGGSNDLRHLIATGTPTRTKRWSSFINLTASYANYTTDWLTNPATGAAWTEAEVEGTDGTNPLYNYFAVESGGDASNEHRCTQAYITVTFTEAGGEATEITPTIGAATLTGVAPQMNLGMTIPTQVDP